MAHKDAPANVALADLGFTDLESEILTFLAVESPVSGYRIAQAIGKPVANTYKAVESLASKGAVILDEGEKRLVRGVPPAELIGRMKREFEQRCRLAEDALKQHHRPSDDERIYAFKTRRQMIERARAMLAGCREIAVADVFPRAMTELIDDLKSTAKRGVAVAVIVYEPVTIAGAEVIVHARAAGALKAIPGEMLSLVVDAEQYLMAYLRHDNGEPHQAVWSHSAFLSFVHHDGLVCLALTQALDQALSGKTTIEQVRAVRERLRRHSVIRTSGMARMLGTTRKKLEQLLLPQSAIKGVRK